jgi:hypothetical protein
LVVVVVVVVFFKQNFVLLEVGKKKSIIFDRYCHKNNQTTINHTLMVWEKTNIFFLHKSINLNSNSMGFFVLMRMKFNLGKCM